MSSLSYLQIYFVTVVSVLMLYLGVCGGAFLGVQYLKRHQHPLILNPEPFKRKSILRDLKLSLISILIFGVSGVFLIFLYRHQIILFSDTKTVLGLVKEVLTLLIWNELHFFLVHRLFHTKLLYKYHRYHHLEPNVSPLAVFSFHWSETVALGSVIPLAFTWGQFSYDGILLFVLASLLLNTLGHSGVAIFPQGPQWLKLSQKHFDHHKYHKVNFGFVLGIFDRLLGSAKDQVIKERTTKYLILFFVLFFAQPKAESAPEVNLWLSNGPVDSYTFSYSAGASILLKNIFPLPMNAQNDPVANPQPFLPAHLKCSEAVIVKGTLRSFQGRDLRFPIYFAEQNGENLRMTFNSPRNTCTLYFENKRIFIAPETMVHPAVSALRQWKAEEPSSMGLAQLLKDPYEALNARFRNLMGYELSLQDYNKKDPGMYLDFSKSPHLDLIIFDTLQIMNDFAGRILLRALEFHARRGTRVTMISSKALLLPQEKVLLENFRKKNPTIQFELYESEGSPLKPADVLNSLHRNSHIKVLLTYSATHPEHNSMIAGGRNQSEMYFYPTKPDNTPYPDIIQWGKSYWYQWGYFDDLDFLVHDGYLLRSVARDLLKYNEKEFVTFQKNKLTDYLISYPFKSGKGDLEKAYVDLFNKAQKTLLIVSPYLNFSKKIETALLQAKNRGVKIQFISNLSVENDFMPFILQPAMYKAYRKILRDHDVAFYYRSAHTMHIKAILVDSESLVLGSVNLNQRSFIHDTEFSVLFKDPKTLQDFKAILNQSVKPYLKQVHLPELPPKSITELFLGPFMEYF